MKNRLAMIYVKQGTPVHDAFGDTLLGQQLPYIFARNVDLSQPIYLHAEVWQERKTQNGMWMQVAIQHQYVDWVAQDPDKEKIVGFCKIQHKEHLKQKKSA